MCVVCLVSVVEWLLRTDAHAQMSAKSLPNFPQKVGTFLPIPNFSRLGTSLVGIAFGLVIIGAWVRTLTS